MQDMLALLLDGLENTAKSMKAYLKANPAESGKYGELEKKVEKLTERVDRLVEMMERRLGESPGTERPRGKRMMDIKQRINEVIAKYPGGIRPPQIAQIIGTRVQNLYPHLKEAVEKKQLRKTETGAYTLIPAKSSKKKA